VSFTYSNYDSGYDDHDHHDRDYRRDGHDGGNYNDGGHRDRNYRVSDNRGGNYRNGGNRHRQ